MTKEKLSFVFPNIMAKFMKKVDMRTQMESSLLSMSMILVGMILMTIYLIIYGNMGGFYKGLIIFNLICAFVFISSFLVTTYQQYLSFMEMSGIDPDKERENVLKRGNLFQRIKLAIKERKAKNKAKQPLQLVDEAIKRMEDIKQEKLNDYQKLKSKADELQEEDLISNTEEEINKDKSLITK